MSKDLPQPQQSEEVDLGQLFSYIEKFFNKIGNLISSIIKSILWLIGKFGILFLMCLRITKKHFIKIVIAGVLTYGVFYLLHVKSTPLYESSIIIKQNYQTGKLLYNEISRLNALAIEGDSIGLSDQLKISDAHASKLHSFMVYDYMNENELLERYFKYIKSIDSTLYVPYSDFKDNYDLENYSFQRVQVISKSTEVFSGLAKKILNSFETNEYFSEEKEKERTFIQNSIKAQKDILEKSEGLQKQYVDLLEKYYGAEESQDKKETTLNINMSNSKEKINTREYELFEEQGKVKIAIVGLQKSLKEKENIIRLQKDFTQAVLVVNKYKKLQKPVTLSVMFLCFLFFFLKEFEIFNVIDKYGVKENLFK